MEIRKWVIDQVKPLLPHGWKLVPYNTNLDVLSQTVVMLKLQAMTRTPSAPNGSHTVSFVLTLIEPKKDPGPREDAIDEKIISLIYALDQVPNITWSNAERVLFDEQYLAFDITLDVITNKE